jgi:hypothetical protein
MKIVSQCREQGGGYKIGTVFEVKKEIPVKTNPDPPNAPKSSK